MLTREQNDLLTQTGQGTGCGHLMRRYWQPAALSEELPRGGPPVPVRLFGEDLALFRDEQGRPGLLGLHCSHRGADLSYGRLEDGGLRCIYHGWIYDVHGRCLEQPGEPTGSTFHEKIRHPAYPCREAGGLILAYLGPGEPPLAPPYEFLMAPEERRYTTKIHQDCNYLQGVEGNLDSQHHSFLHQLSPTEVDPEPPDYIYKEVPPLTEFVETEFGLSLYRVLRVAEDENNVARTNYVLPNLCIISGHPDGYSVNWHVPIDDTHHWKYFCMFRRSRGIDRRPDDERQDAAADGYRLHRSRANRYLQDRGEMKSETFAGLGRNFFVHDMWATETQGPVQDRTREHLGYDDRPIIAMRKVLAAAIQSVQDGREPPFVLRDETASMPDIASKKESLRASVDWRDYCRVRDAWPAGVYPSAQAG